MASEPLFDGGTALGRANILSSFGSDKTGYYLGRAAQYVGQAGHDDLAKHATEAIANASAVVVEGALKAIRDGIPLPARHAVSAGINLGWAIETSAGMQAEDVHKVVEFLENCRSHLKSLGLAKEGVDREIGLVLNPVRNLVNSKHPKPQELPQHKPKVEALQTALKRRMR